MIIMKAQPPYSLGSLGSVRNERSDISELQWTLLKICDALCTEDKSVLSNNVFLVWWSDVVVYVRENRSLGINTLLEP